MTFWKQNAYINHYPQTNNGKRIGEQAFPWYNSPFRVYLYMEQWEKAATYANNVIQNGNFRLLDLKTIDFNPDSPLI